MPTYIDGIATAIHARAEGTPVVPDEDLALYRLYAVLCLALGPEVNRRAVHDAWSAWCAATRPDHPSLVPFHLLDARVQALDDPYVEAIRDVARTLRGDRVP